MLKAIKEFFFGKPVEAVKEDTKTQAINAAPYKVEAPTVPQCGCGRSETGACVGLHKLTPEEWAVHPENKSKAKPAKKKAAPKKAAATKPAAIKATKKPKAKK